MTTDRIKKLQDQYDADLNALNEALLLTPHNHGKIDGRRARLARTSMLLRNAQRATHS